jgi:tRNA G37 N-methylase Trm5
MALKKGAGWIHYYDFQHAKGDEDPVEKTKAKVAEKLDGLGVEHVFGFGRVVRSSGPNWFQTVVDIHVSGCRASFNS